VSTFLEAWDRAPSLVVLAISLKAMEVLAQAK